MGTDSNQYINSYSELELLAFIKGAVNRYIQSKVIPLREREDVEMEVVEKFLKNKEKVLNAFQGKSKLSTYYIAVINRMCCEVIRRDSKQWYSVVNEDSPSKELGQAINARETVKHIVFEQEVQRLKNILLFFNEEHSKLKFFLKVYFDIPLLDEDIQDYATDKSFVVKSILLEKDSKTKGDLFVQLAKVVNCIEGKDIGGDAIRIWFTNQMNTIIRRLNGNSIAQYDRDSLAVLLEIAYSSSEQRKFQGGLLVSMLLTVGSLC